MSILVIFAATSTAFIFSWRSYGVSILYMQSAYTFFVSIPSTSAVFYPYFFLKVKKGMYIIQDLRPPENSGKYHGQGTTVRSLAGENGSAAGPLKNCARTPWYWLAALCACRLYLPDP